VCDVHIVPEKRATLRAVIETVSSPLEIDQQLARVVDIATEATGCYAALVYLRDGERLVLRAASPVHAHLVGRIAMAVGEGVAGWVARHDEPAFIRDRALEDPRHRYFPELEEERFQSMAAVPVPTRSGEVVGVIVLHTVAPHEFDEEILAFLGHTAALLGGAVEHARLYAEASARVHQLTTLTGASEALAATTEAGAIAAAATAGGRAMLAGALCQLFRVESGGRELRLVASDPPGAPAPRPRSGALALALLDRAGRGRSAGDLWAGHEDAALVLAPLVASGERLGVLCCLVEAGRTVGAADEDLLRAIANQAAMALQRAELIARLTERDRVKDFFDALAGGAPDPVVLRAAPQGFESARRHLFIHGAAGAAGAADWEAVAGRLQARLRAPDLGCHLDAGLESLRAAVLLGAADGAVVVHEVCDEVARAEGVVLGIGTPGRGAGDAHRGLREAADAARIGQALKPGGGAVGYQALGAYRYLVGLDLDRAPRDRHWTGIEALLEHDRRRRSALLETLEQYLARRRSVVDTARALYIHPNTLRQRLARIERVAGLDVHREDLLSLELAVKLVRLHDARRQIPSGLSPRACAARR
jgi:GAF domain-containing protein